MTLRLVLASGSPRRHELLKRLNISFDVITSGVDEDVDPALDPSALVAQLARAKAGAVAPGLAAGAVVIGADTDVFLDGLMLRKPVDGADAARMLRQLRGKTHQVISGIAVLDVATMRVASSTVTTQVRMNGYTDDQIDAYVASGEPMDKAGAYAIQGLGGALVKGIEGCYNNVVGFPLCEVARLLAQFGVSANVNGPVCRGPDGQPCPRLNHL